MNNPINEADYIPVSAATPVASFGPIYFDMPGRLVDLELRVSAPASGHDLPVILLSHGHGRSTYLSSIRGYSPLVDFYASHGFAVIQPTHQDSKALGLDPSGPEGALFWRSRAQDMSFILDHLADIERTVPGLIGRLNHSRIGAVGHSMGAHTVAMLAGMRVVDSVDGREWNLGEERIKAGVLLAPPGNGADLAPAGIEHYPVLRNTNFAQMSVPALVVAGDLDKNPDFSERDHWRADAYHFSPAPKCLLTLIGARHSQGGVSGYDAAEATDQDPERLGVVQRMSWAYLRSQLYPESEAWPEAQRALIEHGGSIGQLQCK